MADPTSFFFANAEPGSPLSYAALQTRRKIAEQLMGKRSPFPKTFGEGLTYLGEGIGDAMQMNRLDAAEKQQAAYEGKIRAGFPDYAAPPAGTAGSVENTAVAPAAPPAARPVSDAGTDTTAPVQTAAAPGQPLDVTPSKFANVRYNNPGAQYPVSGENATIFGQQGAGTIGGGHKIAQFPTPVRGAAANMDLLDRNYTGMPIGAAISKWSGGARRNVGGFDTDTVITKEMLRDPSFAIPFMKAVAGGEAPGRYPMNADQWAQAHNMFTGARGAMPPPLPPSDPRGRMTQAIVDQAEPTDPVRTAALTTPGVASDAGPASAIADGASTAIAALPTQQSPPAQTPPLVPGSDSPIVTREIKPMPTQQTAQAPKTMAPEEVLKEQVPAPFQTLVPHPGAEPTPPKPPVPTDAMRKLLPYVNNPNVSPELRADAELRFKLLADQQKQAYDIEVNKYHFDRQQHATDLREHQKNLRELDEKGLEQQIKRTNLAISQQEAGPKLEQLKGQLLELQQKLAAGVAPKTEVDPRTGRIQMWNQKTGKMEDAAPDIKPEHLKLTEGEQKSLNYFVNSHLASTQLGDQKALVGLADMMKGKIPVFGNNWVAPEYRQIKSAADAWIMNTLRSQSGAAIRPEETKDYYAIYFPMYGDKPIDIAAKAARRLGQEESLKASLGPVRPLAEQFEAKRETQRAAPEIPHGKIQQSPSTGKKRINIHGYWEPIP